MPIFDRLLTIKYYVHMQGRTNDSTDQGLQCATVLALTRCFDSQNTLSSYDFSYKILLLTWGKKILQPTFFSNLNFYSPHF